MEHITMLEQLTEAVYKLTSTVPNWEIEPWTDNDGNKGYRYVAEKKAVAFITPEFVHVGELDGVVLFSYDITEYDMPLALGKAVWAANTLARAYIDIEDMLSGI